MTIGGWYKWLVVIVMTGGHVVVTKRLVAMVVAFQLPGSIYSAAQSPDSAYQNCNYSRV